MIRAAIRKFLGITEATALDDGQLLALQTPYNDDGEQWIAIGASGDTDQQKSGFTTEMELANARKVTRYLARKSPHAINGHENRISYIVNYGFTYKVAAKPGMKVSEELLLAAQEEIDYFEQRNRWSLRQQEVVRRCDRDGECFLRFFEDEDGLLVRFVEPEQVAAPSGAQPNQSFGIETDQEDVETVLAYWIDGQPVEVASVQHRKIGVDMTVKRGVPLFWPVVATLNQVPKIRRNMAYGSTIQTAVAYTKTVKGGSRAAAESLRSNNADYTRYNQNTGKTENFEETRPGKIVIKPESLDYQFPFSTTNYSQYVTVIADNLREVAALLVMPEFMLTSDASNANYSSTMVAEGPAVRNFERLQHSHRIHDLELMNRVLEIGIKQGRVPEEVLESCEVQVECPPLATRSRLEEAQIDQIYNAMGILSAQTITARIGEDYDQEQKNIDDHRERMPDAGLPMLPMFGEQPPPGMDGGQTVPAAAGPKTEGRITESGCGANAKGGGGFQTGNSCAGDGDGGGEISGNERNAVRDYTTDKFMDINGALRGDKKLSGDLAENVKNVDAFLQKSPKYKGTVFRVFDDPDGSIEKSLQDGMTYSDKAFLSTSKQKPMVTNHSGRVALQIVGKNGVDISSESENSQAEKEVLFPRNTKFKVIKTRRGPAGGWQAILQEIDSDTQEAFAGDIEWLIPLE